GTGQVPRTHALPPEGGRQQPARLPDVRRRAIVAARWAFRRVHCLLQLSGVQIYAEVRPARRRRWRPGYGTRSAGPAPRNRAGYRQEIGPIRSLYRNGRGEGGEARVDPQGLAGWRTDARLGGEAAEPASGN